jgi:hypothetical protein
MGLTLNLCRFPCSAISASSCRVKPLICPLGTVMTGSATMSTLFIVRLSKERINVGRKRRRAKLINHHKSTTKVGEEQPPSQDNYGQTGVGKGNGFFSEKSLGSHAQYAEVRHETSPASEAPSCQCACKLNELWIACQLVDLRVLQCVLGPRVRARSTLVHAATYSHTHREPEMQLVEPRSRWLRLGLGLGA